ncbi:hypothetical protein, partial [Enterobacter hormaechei]|uniref:hypothetical protein n=1 Tax=Enterobacter hormaechei TaxID=158836 RepID=UPI001BE07D4B
TQPATGETYPKSDLFNKAGYLLQGKNCYQAKYSIQVLCRFYERTLQRHQTGIFSHNHSNASTACGSPADHHYEINK